MTNEPRREACRECRQQKVRCLGRENGSPCQRCLKRGIQCVVVHGFKRQPKRKKIALLEEEMDQLRKRMQEMPPVVPDSNLGALPQGSAKFPSMGYQKRGELDVSSSVINWECSEKRAGIVDLILEPDTIRGLFQDYVEHYHPILPLVDVMQGPEKLYQCSSVLFWTVMAVAARRFETMDPAGQLLEKLSVVQRSSLAEIAVSPVTRVANGEQRFNLPNVYAVQAWLICSLWPIPTSSFNADSSWSTSGMAILTAIRAGLHCPGHERDFARIYRSDTLHQSKIMEQVSTWLAANAVSQSVATMFGYPSMSKFDVARVNAVEAPLRLIHSYAIQSAVNEIEISLNKGLGRGVVALSERLSLIRILARRLDEIEEAYASDFSMRSWFSILAARVNLYCYYLFDDSDELSPSQLQRGYLVLYNSCLALLDHVAQCFNADQGFMKYMPLVDVQVLWQTATVIARLWHSQWSANFDRGRGRALYETCVEVLSQASILEHDVPYRAAEILAQMWTVFAAMSRSKHFKVCKATLTLRSRMAASVFYDSLWTMREECEIRSHAPTVLSERTKSQSTMSTPNTIPNADLVSISPNPSPQEPDWSALPWRDVDFIMKDFGFGMGELEYMTPANVP